VGHLIKSSYSPKNFYFWLVGLTDGDGCFSITRQKGLWCLTFKISLNKLNSKALYYIKKQLGVGSITFESRNCHYRIRDIKSLKNVIIPIFNEYPLLTSKAFNFSKFSNV
jgi:hypothetical protein